MRLTMRNVTVGWQHQKILRGVNLDLEPGRFVVALGASGTGVSLFMKTAAALTYPLGGTVQYDGIDPDTLGEEDSRRLQTRTGFMFQDAALWANTPSEGNLMLPLRARYPDRKPDELKSMMLDFLQTAGYGGDLSLRPSQLSHGRRRFLSFLRAALPGPEILFMDEPILGLDLPWVQSLWARVRDLRAAGTSILAGTHAFADWCLEADRILLLDEGRIVREGSPSEIQGCLPEVMS